ncbi:hypothetical protein BD410DRAFT_837351, partial [Rickenella mellea]
SPNGDKKQFQYQRAYRLSLDLKDSLYVYTSDQVKQIQEHSVLVQRTSATAHSVTDTLASSYVAAMSQVHALSDKMLLELHRLQASTAALPSHLQAQLSGLSASAKDLSAIMTSDAPLGEKITKLRNTVEERVTPLLEGAKEAVEGALKAVTGTTSEKTHEAKEKMTNGIGNGNQNGVAS